MFLEVNYTAENKCNNNIQVSLSRVLKINELMSTKHFENMEQHITSHSVCWTFILTPANEVPQSYSPVQSLSSVNAHFWFYFHRLKPLSTLQILLALCPEQTTAGLKADNSEYCFQPESTNWKASIYILLPAYSQTALCKHDQSMKRPCRFETKIPFK